MTQGCSFRAIALALALCVALPALCHAQEDEYRTTIEAAVDEHAHGRFEESLALFRRAHTLRPSARTLRGLGMASFELRRYASAVGYLDESLASTESPLTDVQRTEVTALLGRARTFVGRYAVETTPPGAAITVDGNEATSPLVLDVGEHTLGVSSAGYEPATRRIVVLGGEDESLTMELTSTAERVIVTTRADPGEPFRIAGWVGVGLGLAGILVGAVAVGVHEDVVSAYNGSVRAGGCPALDGSGNVPVMTGIEGQCYAWQSTWRSMDPMRYVGFIAGGTFLLAGVALVLVGSLMEGESEAVQPMSLACGPFGELGAQCTGSF